MTDAIWRIERKRRQLGISASKLAGAAGINPNHYSDLVHRRKQPRRDTIASLSQALSQYERGNSNASSVQIYRLCLLTVCQFEKADLSAVLQADPKRRATSDPQWLRAAEVRRKALYLANAVCGVSQKQLASAAGLTPAAVSIAMNAVEDACDPDTDPLIVLVEIAIGELI